MRTVCRQRHSLFARLSVLAAGALVALAVMPQRAAAQWSEQVLYGFCSQPGCTDGVAPLAALLMDAAGNLYGTTSAGGTGSCAIGCGTAFRLAPDGTQTVLYSFCSQPGCADGKTPVAGLIIDAAGNLYGTTSGGGTGNQGVGFKLAPDGTYTVLYNFCLQPGCADGAQPRAGLILDAAGNLFGTTQLGQGTGSDSGVVFELAPDGTYTVLHNFCSQPGCADGANPVAGLILDAVGNLFGSTLYGGGPGGGNGVAFKLAPDGTYTVLYSFCSQPGCADGANPIAGLILDAAGNLYGTTSGGGTGNRGVGFKLAPDGTYTVLYNFCLQPGCADGAEPRAGLILDAAGNLFGTTQFQGTGSNGGVVFELAPDGTYTVLYNFCSQPICADGANPVADLILDAVGNLFSTTKSGGIGSGNSGIVFELSPPPARI